MWESEAKSLLEAISRDFKPNARPSMWIAGQKSAVRVIDCVISLNRDYEKIVLPRVKNFVQQFPAVESCEDLARLIRKCPAVERFAPDILNYNYAVIGERVLAVTLYLIDVQIRFQGATEEERLRAWAIHASPEDHKKLGIKGFGLAGFQYLRVLFGAETTKPDKWIIRYVSKSVGRRVSDIHAVRILEKAALIAGRSARRLDLLMWDKGSKSKRSRAARCRE